MMYYTIAYNIHALTVLQLYILQRFCRNADTYSVLFCGILFLSPTVVVLRHQQYQQWVGHEYYTTKRVQYSNICFK